MKIIPINNGYYNVKSINGQIFHSRISESTKNFFAGNNADILKLEEKTYVVGTGEVNTELDKTANHINKILILNMLARFTKSKGNYTVLVTAPLNVYPSQMELLPEYLKGKYKIIHNNKPKEIDIANVITYPETFLVYLANEPEKYEGKELIIIDFGGVTTNVVKIFDNTYSVDDGFAIENGMYQLDEAIASELNTKKYKNRTNFTYEQIQLMRNGKYAQDIYKDEKELFDKYYKKHINEVIKQIVRRGWNYRYADILISGGGGIVLFEIAKNEFFASNPSVQLSKDPIFDNLNGLNIVAQDLVEEDYEEEEEQQLIEVKEIKKTKVAQGAK